MDYEEGQEKGLEEDSISNIDDNVNSVNMDTQSDSSDPESDDSDCVGTWSNKKERKQKRRSPYVSEMEDEDNEPDIDARRSESSSRNGQYERNIEIDREANDGEGESESGDDHMTVNDPENDESSAWNGGIMRSDFEIMWQRKKQSKEWGRRGKKADEIIDDSDKVAGLVQEMQRAADEDIILNCRGKPTTKKIVILRAVMSQLRKRFLQQSFLEVGLLTVLKHWLAPLPNRTMQPLQIRESVLQLLLEFPGIDKDLLKESGIGKAVMYLYKHPKETKGNKKRAAQLIDKWARLIYNKSTDYKDMSKEERMQRDLGLLPKKLDALGRDEPSTRKDFMEDLVSSGKDKYLCPGDKGWIARARVPMPSTKAYIYRPQWDNESSLRAGSKKQQINQFEKFIKFHVITNRKKQASRAVPVSIDGRNTAFYTDDKHQIRNFL